ncbi:MAG: hypothetical protein QCI82_00910 [Candidatus Thermoplasmatota archaeon]|nr:hypothetical protein [Candidatus Thermoplasmatota archaeon]
MTDQCPYCGSEQIISKGYRKTKSGSKPIFMCRRCQKRFVESPSSTYPKHIIIQALNAHTMGTTTAEIARDLRSRYRSYPSRSTIQRWVANYSGICPMARHREKLRNIDPLIRTRDFVHRGMSYRFSLNMYKVGSLKEEGLKRYLLEYQDRDLFEEGNRCSDPSIEVQASVRRTRNLACSVAQFCFSAARTGPERHPIVENFMLINDLATLATEVPVYFFDKRIGTVTGHIDILQVRNGKVHIMDLKPGAASEHPEGQLLLYSQGLSFRTGVPLSDMVCSWFDDKDCFSFDPSEAKWKY